MRKNLNPWAKQENRGNTKGLKQGIPIVSIIGYTNAGKSTLLNSLTKSIVFVEDKLFATLDTASRRLRFPHERDVIVTDTVGFIRDLPKDLFSAFKATLEELEDADLLLHLVDISNPRFEQAYRFCREHPSATHVMEKPRLLVFNKIDRISREEADNLAIRYNAIGFPRLDPSTFGPLLKAIEEYVWEKRTTGGET